MRNKILSDFELFERMYESVNNGSVPSNEADINEGIFSGILNFFSKVFGGRVDQIDAIIERYKKNEASYWKRWADANHEYNKAVAKRDKSEDAAERRKHLEMMERANKLITQTNKTRTEVNDALDRQAMMLVRNNVRLRKYFEMKKAKADEAVANKSYSTLKDKVDSDVVDQLYDRMIETEKLAKSKVKAMPKGSATIEFGQYEDASGKDKEVPFKNFGIHDVDDFIFSDDKLWNDRIELMPKGNLERLSSHIIRALRDIKETTSSQVDKLKKKLDDAEGAEKTKLDNDIKYAEKYFKEDERMLNSRLEQVTKMLKAEPKADKIEKEEEPAAKTDDKSDKKEDKKENKKEDKKDDIAAAKLDDMKAKVAKRTGATGGELDNLYADILAMYDKIPAQDRSGKEDIRIGQLVDFAKDVRKFREDKKVTGKLSGKDLADIYNEFKKEFPL